MAYTRRHGPYVLRSSVAGEWGIATWAVSANCANAGLGPLELVAACDPVEANAVSLAEQAEAAFGKRPAVVATIGDLHDHGVQAVDVTSTPRTHHLLAVEALEAGLHVLIEKADGADRDRVSADPGRGCGVRSDPERRRKLPPRPDVSIGQGVAGLRRDRRAAAHRPARCERRRPDGHQHVAAPP